MRVAAIATESRSAPAPSRSTGPRLALAPAGRSTLTDDELVASARGGDEGAMVELLARYEGKLFRLAMRIVRNEHDAQEVLQDVSFAVWRRLPGFEGRAQIGTWLYRVTVNAALMFLRSRSRGPRPLLADNEAANDCSADGFAGFESIRRASRTPDDQLQFAELHCEIQKAVEGLPQGLRAVFLARLVEGRSTQQTAESLGLSTIAVKTRLHRARAMLRANIEGYRGQD